MKRWISSMITMLLLIFLGFGIIWLAIEVILGAT